MTPTNRIEIHVLKQDLRDALDEWHELGRYVRGAEKGSRIPRSIVLRWERVMRAAQKITQAKAQGEMTL